MTDIEGMNERRGIAQPAVVIYTRQFCGFCSLALRLLQRKGVAYTEHDATGNPALRAEMIQRSMNYTFPQIFIGDAHVGGFSELAEWERSGALDRALGRSTA
jgi:glutaredoxin 3